MTLAFLSLGSSAFTGKASIDQCVAMKRQLLSVLPAVENAHTLLSVDPETRVCEVRVVFDREDERAVEWAKKAEAMAPEIWETLTVRRKEVGR